ncbi:MAG: APC family permease [Anaerolineae bacterium]
MLADTDGRTNSGSSAGLRRELGIADAVAIGLGAIVGAGLFVVTGVAAGVAGPAFLIGLIVAALVATLNALSSAQLAASYPQSGGTYEYGYRLLRPVLGYIAGWMFLVSKLAAAGTVARGFGGYLRGVLPWLPERLAAVAAIVGLAAINYAGIKKAGRLNTAIVSVTLAALVWFVVSGANSFSFANLKPFSPQGISGVMESAALLFFAYTGYARLATLGEEVRDPRRTIPRAILISLGIAAVLYALVSLVAVGAVGAPALAATSAPLEQAALHFRLPGAVPAVAIGASTAMLGVLLSQILGISRMLYAMARRGDLPALLGHVHSRHRVPDYGVLLAALAALLVAVLGTIRVIVSAAAFTILVYYGVTNLAALRLPAGQRLYPHWISVAGLAGCVALALSLPAPVILTGLVLLASGLVWRTLYRATARPRELDGRL